MPYTTLWARLLVTCVFVTVAAAHIPSVFKPYDVVDYFCQRWYHQSVVKNGSLYIYGGIQSFNVPGSNSNWTNNILGYNPSLLLLDLSKSWDWKTNLSYTALALEANPLTGTYVRNNSIHGTVFQGPAYDPNVYTYGGTTFRGNESFPTEESDYHYVQYSDQYPLWSFDNSTQTWNQYDIKQSWTPNYGAAAEAPDQGLAFYLSGRTDNGTSSSTIDNGDIQTPLNGMIAINMLDRSSQNLSTSGMQDAQPRIGGTMQYAPGVGDNGVIVALGGKVFDGLRTTTSRDKGRLLQFDSVDVFDIASYLQDPEGNGTWYSQKTSGDVPPPRIDFCSVIVSAPDNSSHNIYIYAGRDDTTSNGTTLYDDIYVLSLPSFTWINVFSGKSPRFGHTCHVVGKRQVITVGGHNRHQNKCDWEKKGVAILDLQTLGWGSVFHADAEPYELSDNIAAVIGGGRQGGATSRAPANGWASPAFGALMSKTRIYSEDGSPVTISSSTGLDPKLRIAAVAGGTIGGTVLITCTCWLIYIFHQRRTHKSRPNSTTSDSPIFEIDGHYKLELGQDEKKMYEVTGTECRHEIPDSALEAEADAANAVTYAVELPTTNFHEKGRWGVPVIRVPSPASSRTSTSRGEGTGDMV